MTEQNRSRPTRPDARWAIVAIGQATILAVPARWYVFEGGLVPDALVAGDRPVELAFTGGFGLTVLVVGIWIAGRGAPHSVADYSRVARRCLGGFGIFGLIVLSLLAVQGESAAIVSQYVLFAAAVGAVVGTVFGLQEAQAVERARAVERQTAVTERVEAERTRLEYLNRMLRHEVLNDASIISGYADLALADATGETREHLLAIEEASTDMARVIRDIRLLIDALGDSPDGGPERIDLARVLATELASLGDTYVGVEVDADLPSDVWVRGDEPLARSFRNVLSNAVVHGDGPRTHVAVTLERSPETVRVHVADDGPGVPDEELERLFEPSGRGDHGFGLYLAQAILHGYGGSIELTETGPDGSVFTISLPAVDGPGADGGRRVGAVSSTSDDESSDRVTSGCRVTA